MRVIYGILAIAAIGCSVRGSSDAVDGRPATTTTSASTTTLEATTTTIVLSAGVVRVGPAAYDLVFTCVAPGAGEVLAVGAGTDINGKPVQAWVQAFLGEPYVGLQVGEDGEEVLFESRLESSLDFTLVNDVVRFVDVDFVTDLDLETGDFTPAGLGSVTVECRSYDDELPPSAFS